MKMNLYYVAEKNKKSAQEGETEGVRFQAGPFGSWDKALDAKKKAEDKRLSSVEFCIVTQVIDVEFFSY